MAGERTVKIKFTGDSTGVAKASAQGEQSVSKFGKAVEKSNALAGKAAAAGGAAIAAGFAIAVSGGIEQSQIKAKLAAQLGATGPAAKTAGDAAGDLYARGVVESMDEAAGVVKTIFQNGLVPKDAGKAEIDAVAARVSTLATTLDEDASSVGRAVAQMVKTGIAKSSEEAFDILAKGTQLGINKSEDLLDTFNEYGTQFRNIGLEGPQALGLLNQAIQAGARDSDQAADAIKEFGLRAVDGSKGTANAFKSLGLDADDFAKKIAAGGPSATKAFDTVLDKLREVGPNTTTAKQAVAALFGGPGEDLGGALFALDVDKAAASVGKLDGAAAQAGKTLEESAGAKVQAFTRMLQGELIGALSSVIGWLQKNEELVKTLAVVLGPIAGLIAAIVAITRIYTAVQAALTVVMNLSPFGLIVIAIVALIAVIALIATKTQFFQKLWAAVWGAIKTAAEAVKNWFTGTLVPSLKKAFDELMAVVSFVVNFYKKYFNLLLSIGRALVNGYVAYVKTIVSIIRSIASTVKSVVDSVVDKFGQLIGFIAGLPKRVAAASRGLWDGIKNSFRAAINYVIDKWNSLSFSLPSINTPFGKIGGTTISTPNIPRLATGGWMQPGKTYLTGENGPELLTSGRPAYVNNAGATADMGGTPEVHVYIGDRELTDIVDVRITQNNRQTRRAAGARLAGVGA